MPVNPSSLASPFNPPPPHTPQVVVKRRQPGSGEDPGGEGGLVLEGALSPDYYKIREVVYAQYHIC